MSNLKRTGNGSARRGRTVRFFESTNPAQRLFYIGVSMAIFCLASPGCAKKTVEWSAQGADDLLHEIRMPVSNGFALSGAARISSETPDALRKGRTYFALRAPNQLLLEAVTPSDETVAVLVTNEDRFMGFEVGDARCRTGAPCAENVGMLFPVALDNIQLIRLLHGRPPLIGGQFEGPTKLKAPARLRVAIKGENQIEQFIDFSPDGKDVLATDILREGEVSLRIKYAEYRDVSTEVRIPGELIVENPQQSTRVRIQVTDVNFFDPTPDTFGTQCPVGKLIMPMTCGPSAVVPQ